MEAQHNIPDDAATSGENTPASSNSLTPVTPNSGPGRSGEAAHPSQPARIPRTPPIKGNKWPNIRTCDKCFLLGYSSSHCDWASRIPHYRCANCHRAYQIHCSFILYEQNKDDPNEEIPPLPERGTLTRPNQTRCDQCSEKNRKQPCDWAYEWPKGCSACQKKKDSCTIRRWTGKEYE